MPDLRGVFDGKANLHSHFRWNVLFGVEQSMWLQNMLPSASRGGSWLLNCVDDSPGRELLADMVEALQVGSELVLRPLKGHCWLSEFSL